LKKASQTKGLKRRLDGMPEDLNNNIISTIHTSTTKSTTEI
jgi:hypothetical protein